MSVQIDLSGIEKRFSEPEKRQATFAQRAAFLMRKYVPVEETPLRSSEPENSDYGKGEIIWNTPYAARQYHVEMNHTEPGTTDHWDQTMKENDMEGLVDFAKRLYQ